MAVAGWVAVPAAVTTSRTERKPDVAGWDTSGGSRVWADVQRSTTLEPDLAEWPSAPTDVTITGELARQVIDALWPDNTP